ncbi:MAG: N,N-dimethylformamidase beta subunit family domain-containing protein [Alphaproteobacteria bacterium]
MLKIIGYCDRLSVAPGDRVNFKVHTEVPVSYRARIHRIIHGDANPDGPGFKADPVATPIDGTYEGRPQQTQLGSYIQVPNHPELSHLTSFTVAAMIWPTLPDRGRQGLLTHWQGNAGFRLEVGADGALAAVLGDGRSEIILASARPMQSRRWYMAALSYDAVAKTLTLVQDPLDPWPHVNDGAVVEQRDVAVAMPEEAALFIAARAGGDTGVTDIYDGKIDSPIILNHAVAPAALASLFLRPMAQSHRRHIVAHWDFSRRMSGTRAIDIGPFSLDGDIVNLPARAMTGWNWTAESQRWTEKPEQYGAIHFHHDDIYDCGWDTAFTLDVPADLPSGAYAAHVSFGDTGDTTTEDYIAFFVRPPRRSSHRRSSPRPKAALLIPTASYMAYANDHSHLYGDGAEMIIGRLLVYQPTDLYLQQHRELGMSLYDTHADGSGVCYSSYLRPVLNLRPKYASWLGAHGSGLWQFNADTHLIDWLDHEGFDVDIITDEDLEAEGAALLQPYRVVLTGTHPEYHSKPMSDAVLAWRDNGGRLMYLGGNGWYWRIARHPELPGVIEVRRAEGGTRTWAAEPGEYYHSFTGEFGGLWRRNGRPPNAVVGLGFSAQGFDISSYYRRQPGSFDPRAAFIFDGVEEEIIGDFGLVGGGAAGLELDCANHQLGTPANTLILATSEDHTDLILPVTDETDVMAPNLTGSQSDRVRADLIFFETSSGGAVFSTGSIAWCGSLSHNGYDNNVARIMGNVLRRFLDPKSFAGPTA